MYRIALVDEFHIHARNFPSFFNYMEAAKIEPDVFVGKSSENYRLINATGLYGDVVDTLTAPTAELFRSYCAEFMSCSADEMYNSELHAFPLWSMCRSELLGYLLTLPSWQTEVMVKDDRAIFQKAFDEHLEILAGNMAAAKYWTDFWYGRRADIFKYHYCMAFSGSMIYTRTLLELLRRSPTRAFVLESTFTGNDFIFEEAYHPIANNLRARQPTARFSRRPAETQNTYEREVIKARNKILAAKNKNVQQPAPKSLPVFPAEGPQVLIVGQVVNDYSLIEDGYPYCGSIPVYIELITRLLNETAVNIVFKSHPWESKKTHVKSQMTFNHLETFVRALSPPLRSRIMILEDVNLHALIEESQYFLTFCSQAGIEAALFGLRPFVMGEAFYSNAGFTADCADIDSMVQAVKTLPGALNLKEYAAFDRYIVDLFQYGTVAIFDSGKTRIASLLDKPKLLEQKLPIRSEIELDPGADQENVSSEFWSGIFREREALPLDADLIRSLGERITMTISPSDGLELLAGQPVSVDVKIFNDSNYIIPSRLGGRQLQLSYHVLNADGSRCVWNGQPTPLRGRIEDGARKSMIVALPEKPGKYTVIPAILHPGVCWIEAGKPWEIEVG